MRRQNDWTGLADGCSMVDIERAAGQGAAKDEKLFGTWSLTLVEIKGEKTQIPEGEGSFIVSKGWEDDLEAEKTYRTRERYSRWLSTRISGNST